MILKSDNKLFYGWVIVILLIFISMVLAGTRFSFGIFFKPLAGEFLLTRTATSSLLSVFMLLCALFTIVGGWTLDRYGPRIVFLLMGIFTGLSLVLTSQANSLWQLFITYSLLLSLGTGPFYPVTQATVSKWFEKKRGLAMGIAGSGGRLGQVVFSPLCAFLISSFGWRVAYLVIGLISWVVLIPASRLLRDDPRDIGTLPDGAVPGTGQQEENGKGRDSRQTGLSINQAIRTANFQVLIPVWLFMGLNNLLVFTHVVPYATDVDITAMKAAIILSVIGAAAIPGGILAGKISDVIGRKTPLIAFSLLRAGSLIGLIWARELWEFYLFAIAFGISIGSIGIMLAALTVDIFGKRSIGVILATLDMCYAIGATIGPLVGGWVYDVNSNYTLSFLIAAAGSAISAFLIIFIKTDIKPEFAS
ncbi:MFS transporter [Chloroflexota bacterium]